MRTRKGTGYIIALFLALFLLCSVGLVAQDNILVTKSNDTSTPNPASLNCWYLSGSTCLTGQYLRGDGTKWSSSVSFTASPYSFFGLAANNISNPLSNGLACTDCHNLDGSGIADMNSVKHPSKGDYVISGHKNILRKVVPGQPLRDTQGNTITTVADLNGATYTMDWTGGKANGTTGSFTAYYLAGWNIQPDVFGNGLPNYGACARCHTTGYRFDGTGPEPTTSVSGTLTKLTDAQFPRVPSGGAPGTTSSWYLTGIQCERCHHADMQTAPPNNGFSTSTSRALNHYPTLNFSFFSGTIPNIPDWTYAPVYSTGMSMLQLNPPVGSNVCYECHRTETAWTPTSGNGNGEVHVLPLPGQENLVAKPTPTASLTGPALTGQFTSGGNCSNPAYTNYTACTTNGGTFGPYKPSVSHGSNGAQTFLNSPHARFTGTMDVTAQASPDQSVTINGTYSSAFVTQNNGGGCTTCHDVHGTTVNVDATNYAQFHSSAFPTNECVNCHTSHAGAMSHPTGPGTPFPNGFSAGSGDSSSCVTCHMAAANGTASYHFFRINADVNYNTFPSAATYYTSVGAGAYGKENTYIESYTSPTSYQPATYQAVGLDVDIACGQCHTGGNGSSNPYGLTAYAGNGGVQPKPYTRAFLAASAVSMHNPAASAPTFNVTLPGAGGPKDIIISSSQSAEGSLVSLFYTLDGTTPQVLNNTTAVGTTIQCVRNPCDLGMISSTTTIYAVASGPLTTDFSPSPVAGGTYLLQVAPKPVITPATGNLVLPTTMNVTITDSVTGAAIYYTTDGSIPTASSTLYTGTIAVSKPEVINAIAIVPNYVNSPVAAGTFTSTAPAPAFSLNTGAKYPGSYVGAVQANLTDTAPSLCYTLNGTTPVVAAGSCVVPAITVASGTNIAINASATITAVAFGPGFIASKMTSGTYVIAAAAAPAFSLNGGLAKYPGTYVGAVQANLTDAAPSLCYTLNGATPVVTAGVCMNGTTVASGTNIAINASATITAVAFSTGSSASKVTSGVYVIK